MANFWENDPVVSAPVPIDPNGAFWANDAVVTTQAAPVAAQERPWWAPKGTIGDAIYQLNQPGEMAGDYEPSMVPFLDPINAAANNFVRQIPIVGPALETAGNHVDAAFASLVEGKPVTAEDRAAINQAEMDKFPLASGAGGVAGAVAPLAGAGIAIPAVGRALGMTGGMGSQMLAGTLSGGTIAAADTVARGGSAQDAGVAALAGGGIGLVAPWAAKGVGSVVNNMAGKSAPAHVRTLAKGLDRDKIDPKMVQARMDAIGADAVMADLGPNLTRQAAAIASLPGEGQATLRATLGARNQGTNQRVQKTVNEIIGEATTPAQVAKNIRAEQDTLSPLYEKALEGARPVDTRAVAEQLDMFSNVMRGSAQKSAQSIRKWLDVTGKQGQLDTNPRTLFETRKAIDGMLETAVEGNEIHVLGEARKAIDAVLTDAVPGIKVIDGEFQRLAQMKEAFGEGQQVLDSGRTAVRPSDLAKTAAEMPEDIFQYMSDGTRAEIDRIIGTTANNLTALKSALKGDGSWNRQRLATMFGQEKADALLEILEREMTYNRTFDAVMRNSETAARLAAQADVAPAQYGTKPAGILDFALALPQKAANAAARGRSEKVNAELARILASQPAPELVDQLIASRTRGTNYVPPAAAGLILGPEEPRTPLRIVIDGANPIR
jgi:hypothetical protein